MTESIFIEIEEILNQKFRVKRSKKHSSRSDLYDEKIFDEINSHINETVEADLKKSLPLYDLIISYIKRMNNSRFLRKNGEVKEATFYQYAKIDKSTWSEIKWDQITPSKKTLLKLIIALELTHEEAEDLLDRVKERFDPNDIQDQIIEAIMIVRKRHHLTVNDIECILFEYQEMYSTTKPFDCIYETPKMSAERKKKLAEGKKTGRGKNNDSLRA